jgi:hypothetical protein
LTVSSATRGRTWVEQGAVDPLPWWRVALAVLDSDVDLAAGAVGEADAVVGKVVAAGRLARDLAQRLALELMALLVHNATLCSVKRRPR